MAMLDTASRPWNKPKAGAPTLVQAVNPIDELARVRAEKAKLEKEEEALVALVRGMGAGEHLGTKVIAEVSTYSKESLDTKAIKEAMPDAWIEKFTKKAPVTTIRIKPLV